MSVIANLTDFKKITSNITSFSHAYLFCVNSLEYFFPYIKEFAKEIILKDENDDNKELISYQIDENEFDDLYIVNPSTIGISTSEIEHLFDYMKTKSLRQNGKRVYIIYGFERLTREVSNKILKFLEEPSENVYALLMTENIDAILPTIISRCQMINLSSLEDINSSNIVEIKEVKKFLTNLVKKKFHMIAYELDYFENALLDRKVFDEVFGIMERIISSTINYKIKQTEKSAYVLDILFPFSIVQLSNLLRITNSLKYLIKQNINLNLLLDRYIIEMSEELESCRK